MSLIDAGLAHAAAQAAFGALVEHDKSPAYRATREWLEALATQQLAHMTDCRPERLPEAQVRFQQLRALVAALEGRGGTGHCFD